LKQGFTVIESKRKKNMVLTKKNIIGICSLVVLSIVMVIESGCGKASEESISTTATPSTQDTTLIGAATSSPGLWNVTSIEEGEQITSFKIYSPGYMPPEFVPNSKIMINTVGVSVASHLVVTRVWKWNKDSSVYFTLTESPKSFGIGGGKDAEINGHPGQIALIQNDPNIPDQLTLAWEQDGLNFSINGILKGPLDEAMLRQIAASIEHS
jgi:hypothetical protein